MNVRYLIKRLVEEQPLRLGLSIVTLTVAGLLEGVGIAAIVPMMQIVQQGGTASAGIGTFGQIMTAVLGALGLPFDLATVLGFILLFVLASQLAVLAQQKLLAGSSALFEATLRRRLFAAVFDAGWPYFVKTKAADIGSIIINDTGRSGTAYVVLVQVLGTIIVVAVYAILALILSWQMTVATAVVSVIVVVLLRNRTGRGTGYGKAGSAIDAEIQSETMEDLAAAKLVKASSAEDEVQARFDDLTEQRQRIQYRNLMNQAWLKTFYDSASIVTVFVGIYVAVTFFGLSVAKLTVFLFIFYRLSPRISGLQSSWSLLLSLIPGLGRVDDFTSKARAEREDTDSGMALGPMRQSVSLKDVTFGYQVDRPVLSTVSIEVPQGKSTAIVGPSGAGKTTVMDLVMGLLVPDSGEVLVDGHSLGSVRLSDWRGQIGYVPQDASFFHTSVGENIAWGFPDATSRDVEEAAALAHAADFISDLPEGYDTLVGDRGVRLSGGQRQRLALARAIVRKPSVLILDEATSALDAEAERRVQQAVDGLAGSMTILIVTHRLATVRNCDVIHVIDTGRVVESGSWDGLSASGGRFAELAALQGIKASATHGSGEE